MRLRWPQHGWDDDGQVLHALTDANSASIHTSPSLDREGRRRVSTLATLAGQAGGIANDSGQLNLVKWCNIPPRLYVARLIESFREGLPFAITTKLLTKRFVGKIVVLFCISLRTTLVPKPDRPGGLC